MKNKCKTIPVFVPHWGCPCDCLFCDQKKITGQKTEMTPELASQIIRAGVVHRKPGEHWEIGYFGGSFTGIPASQQEALLQLAQEAVSKGWVNGIRLSTRPDYINEAVLNRLRHYGVTTVELGAQSMDDEVLCLCRRGHTAAQTRQAAEKIHQSGLELGLQMMVGLPGDSMEKTMKTAYEFAALSPACVRIYPTLVIKGTGLEQLYRAGKYTPLTVTEAVLQCCRLYRFFSEHGIQVIRMGLLQMSPADIAAGPFHPAFGELVLSEYCYEKAAEQLSHMDAKQVSVRLNPRFVSAFVGQKKINLLRLSQRFSLGKIKLIQDAAVPMGDFLIQEIDY